jgi:hypothetical protein
MMTPDGAPQARLMLHKRPRIAKRAQQLRRRGL